MCNLFSNTMPVEAMRRLFDVAPGGDRLGNQPPLPAIFPRHDAPIVRLGEAGARELVRAHWGFLMPQVLEKTGEPILPRAINNARDDKLRASSFWRESFEMRRCLIPATAFCEAKGRKPATYYWFGMAAEGEGEDARPPFAFAGLWRRFRGRYRDALVEIDTCTMITTTPNPLVRDVHPDRMPAILPWERHEAWLEGPAAETFPLIGPYPAEAMRIVRVGESEKADPAPERWKDAGAA